MRWLDHIGWIPLLVAAILLGLAPFRPEPHLFEKLRMLSAGTLTAPVDVFDLILHGAPLALVVAKSFRHARRR